MSYKTELQHAVNLALAAGQELMERLPAERRIEYKSAIDLVTDADHAAEDIILSGLRRQFPQDDILSEETGAQLTGAPRRWIVDPLDGTTNYAHAYPCFCVSIGLAARDSEFPIPNLDDDYHPVVGVVYQPFTDELFTAVAGQGARLNGDAIQVSDTQTLESSLLASGFPYDRKERADFYLKFYREFLVRTHGIRRDGAAAVNLSYLACGRFDGFWEFGLHAWDIAAAALLITEAGGQISDLSGGPTRLDAGRILASNGRIHAEMAALLQRTDVTTGRASSAPSQ